MTFVHLEDSARKSGFYEKIIPYMETPTSVFPGVKDAMTVVAELLTPKVGFATETGIYQIGTSAERFIAESVTLPHIGAASSLLQLLEDSIKQEERPDRGLCGDFEFELSPGQHSLAGEEGYFRFLKRVFAPSDDYEGLTPLQKFVYSHCAQVPYQTTNTDGELALGVTMAPVSVFYPTVLTPDYRVWTLTDAAMGTRDGMSVDQKIAFGTGFRVNIVDQKLETIGNIEVPSDQIGIVGFNDGVDLRFSISPIRSTDSCVAIVFSPAV